MKKASKPSRSRTTATLRDGIDHGIDNWDGLIAYVEDQIRRLTLKVDQLQALVRVFRANQRAGEPSPMEVAAMSADHGNEHPDPDLRAAYGRVLWQRDALIHLVRWALGEVRDDRPDPFRYDPELKRRLDEVFCVRIGTPEAGDAVRGSGDHPS